VVEFLNTMWVSGSSLSGGEFGEGERQAEMYAMKLRYSELADVMIALNASIPTPPGIDSLA